MLLSHRTTWRLGLSLDADNGGDPGRDAGSDTAMITRLASVFRQLGVRRTVLVRRAGLVRWMPQ